ncbi:MAG: UDP-N-acetylmuramate--alanine ligase [Ignavibacteria bacterium]|nr:UDP-N-acetylmuramate--alanine ligase [Ignavibacteria bacterium]
MNIHFIGIGGTAMGSVAVACRALGHTVTGSDSSVYSPMSDVLHHADVHWFEGFDENHITNAAPDLVVIGNAVSRGNVELEFVLDNRLPYTSMADLVGKMLISRNTSIVVAGTHGKTTTACMTAWLLEHAGYEPGFLIGGVPSGHASGCLPIPKRVYDTRAGVFVCEGDEYDTAFFDKRSKFIHYRPTVAIVNNIEFDHADIFRDIEDIALSFDHLLRIVPRNGLILVNSDDPLVMRVANKVHAPVESVGLADTAHWRITDLKLSKTQTSWTLKRNGHNYGTFTTSMNGLHNIRNASMAIASTLFVGLTLQEQQNAMQAFRPPKRRLENIGFFKNNVVIDDFAHHPTAIAATLAALRQQYPEKRIHAVFEPRSNTTTRSFFQHELAECFDGAYSVCIGPLNRPERYKPEERLDTQLLANSLVHRGIKTFSIPVNKGSDPEWGRDVLTWLDSIIRADEGVIVVLSNGNAGGLRSMLIAQS